MVVRRKKIEIVLPEGAGVLYDGDEVNSFLRALTRMLEERRLVGKEGIGLGGEFNYGANFENPTFLLHRYCWCDEEDCPWCSGPTPNFWHKPSGFRVWWYKWIGRGMEVENPNNISVDEIKRSVYSSLG